MLANFFGQSKPINFIILLLFFLGAYFLSVFTTFSVADISLLFLLEKLGFFVLLMLLFTIVSFVVSKNKLTYDNTYALLFYLLLVVAFVPYFTNIRVIFEVCCYLLFLRKLYSLHTLKQFHKKLFDAGFWLGVLWVCNSFAVLFFILLFVALILHKRFRLQTIIVFLVGALCPVFLFFTYCFWQDQMDFFMRKWPLYTAYDFSLYGTGNLLFPVVFCAFLVLFSLFVKTTKVWGVSNSFKIKWLLLLLQFILCVLFFITTNQRNGSEILILAFPVAVILANGLEMVEHKILKESLLFLLMTVVLLFAVT